MISVSRRAYIDSSSPEEVFESLSNPNRICQLLPRMQKVELLDQNMETSSARMITYMSLGGIFGTIRCEGDLTWKAPGEILFKVHTPVSLETRWTLNPAVHGTDLKATMVLDLEPMLGPMAAFVPKQIVSDMLAGELEAALTAIREDSTHKVLHERTIAA